jgi:hypothetical protein
MTIQRHPFNRVFVAGVGLGHNPVDDGWSAFDQEHLWFAKPPRQVPKGAHVFALGAGRGSAVLGLYEVTGGGPERRPANPWDAERWPWNLAVRALATVPPPVAERVDGVRAPRSTAARVREAAQIAALYAAIDDAHPAGT